MELQGGGDMIYITGDTHGDFRNVVRFCEKMQTNKDDVLIILGDAGVNYYGGEQDEQFSCRVRNPLGAFRHKQDSTLVAEQAAIFSVCLFLRVNI